MANGWIYGAKTMPKVLWLIDNPKWAYASIVRQVGQILDGYQHEVYCFAAGPVDPVALDDRLKTADVIMCMYIQYIQAFADRDNVVLFVSGMRPFE